PVSDLRPAHGHDVLGLRAHLRRARRFPGADRPQRRRRRAAPAAAVHRVAGRLRLSREPGRAEQVGPVVFRDRPGVLTAAPRLAYDGRSGYGVPVRQGHDSRCEMRAYRVLAILLLICAGCAAAADETSQVVLLVRHAEKAQEPADDVALTAEGSARAEALAAALVHAQVDAIITTQFRRARETAEPLAKRLGITPMVVEAGSDTGAHARAVADAVRRAGRTVLVVGHTNTVPA